jgi:Fis family transcriptional regulator, factor for inversion stimulation protein
MERNKKQPLFATLTCAPRSTKCSLAGIANRMHSAGISYQTAVQQFQERYIAHVLTIHKVHLGKTAEELEMHRNTLSRTLAELDIDVTQIRCALRQSPVRSMP